MNNKTVHRGNHAKIIKVFDRLFFREGNLEIRDQCNTGIVELKNAAAIIDYPEQWPDEELIGEAEGLLKKPVKYIFITHAHGDHIAGLKTLHRKDITLIASKACIEQIAAEGYPIPENRTVVTESTELELDGFKFKLTLPGRTAHSPWDMLVGVPWCGAVFTGDLVVAEKYMYFHTSDLKGWITTLEETVPAGWEWICRGHGGVTDGEYLRQAVGYLKWLERAVSLQTARQEKIDVHAVRAGLQNLSPALKEIVNRLLERADAVNIARQINQLAERAKG